MLDLLELQRHACHQREDIHLAAAQVGHLRIFGQALLQALTLPPLNQLDEECTRVARYAHRLQRDEVYEQARIGVVLQDFDVGMAEDAYVGHLFLLAAARRRCGGGEEEMVPWWWLRRRYLCTGCFLSRSRPTGLAAGPLGLGTARSMTGRQGVREKEMWAVAPSPPVPAAAQPPMAAAPLAMAPPSTAPPAPCLQVEPSPMASMLGAQMYSEHTPSARVPLLSSTGDLIPKGMAFHHEKVLLGDVGACKYRSVLRFVVGELAEFQENL